jgi:ubiquinone/menaquinone biosynthesis C-methylase UbiE/uncharacterized protein YbaR (Trm112 family)
MAVAKRGARRKKMKTELFDVLCCPLCRGSLSVKGMKDSSPVDLDEIVCTGCGRGFPVEDGIPRFIESSDLQEGDRRFEIFRRLFYAHVYDPSTRLMLMLCGGEKQARLECLERLDIRSGCRILETGIGTASNLPYLFEMVGESEIFGIDISASMLRICAKKLSSMGHSTKIFQARAERLPFRDNSFDSVFHIGAINIFEDKKPAIDEMIRVARPGTKIVIADESDKTSRLWDKLLLPRLLRQAKAVVPPVDLVPRNMTDIKLDSIWKGFGYCIEFRTPVEASS